MNFFRAMFLISILFTTLTFAQSFTMSDTIKYYAPPIKGLKSETAAVWWSIGATFVPSGAGALLIGLGEEGIGAGMIITSFMIGPSAGHFYAEQWGKGLKTTGIRLGIGAVGCASTIILAALTVRSLDPEYADEMFISLIPTAAASVAVIVYGIYDITTTPASVRKYNEQLKLQIRPELDLREKKFGFGLVYHF
jgi:hypothetical protein